MDGTQHGRILGERYSRDTTWKNVRTKRYGQETTSENVRRKI